jgi:ABC-type polysaccharide/polyol phosphate transport system ATPase subunit
MERVILKNISKKFRKDPTSKSTLYKLISIISKRSSKEKFLVLDDISIIITDGEIIGIIGENGSGKSTFLRIIAGIYKADSGEIKTNGKIISIIDLNASLQSTLTMEDNIYLCGAFLGLDKKEIQKKFSEIVKFSGLEEFVNTRLYKFSNGMMSRLIFSIAINCNPEILLLDEIFAVGDEDFKNKSSEKIRELVKEGCCAIVAGHDLELMKKQCNKVIWLDKGRIKMGGNPEQVIENYRDHKFKT